MNEQQMYDLFKKHFGFKKATKYKVYFNLFTKNQINDPFE
jgi:hypothetical protein